MNKIIFVFSALLLSSCRFDVDVQPQVNGVYESRTVEVFDAVFNGNAAQYRKGAGYFLCNPVDFFVYDFDTNAAILNDDSTQVACDPTVIFRTETTEQIPVIPVIEN